MVPATMDAADLAFAGLARQAQLIASGEVSSRELVDVALARIERIDPQLNAFRIVFAQRARTEAEQADGRRGAGGERPLLGVPVAVKDDMHVAGEITAQGTAAVGDAVAGRQRDRSPPARGRRDRDRQDQRARADDVAVHGDGHLRRDAQSVGPGPHPGRLERRHRRGGRRRPGRRRHGVGRPGLHPHPRGLQRAVRPEGPEGTRADRARDRGRLARARPLRHADALGGRHRAVPRRGGRPSVVGLVLRRGGDRARAAARGAVVEGAATDDGADRRRGARGRRGARRSAALPGPYGRRARSRLRRGGDRARAGALHARRAGRRERQGAPRPPGAPHQGDGSAGAPDAGVDPRALEGRGGRVLPAAEPHLRRRRRRPHAHAVLAPAEDRRLRGPRGAVDVQRRRALRPAPGPVEHRPATPPRRSRPASRRRACRWPRSSSGARATRRRC